jgi:signal transduction histidine kinase
MVRGSTRRVSTADGLATPLPVELGPRPLTAAPEPARRMTAEFDTPSRPSPLGRDETVRVRERFERLLEAGVSISRERSLEEVLQRIVDAARAVVGARYAALGVIGADHSTLVQFETAGLSRSERERIGTLPSGKGVLGLLIRDPRPLRIAKLTGHEAAHGFPPNHPRMESFLGVPILGRERVWGNLYLTEKIGAAEFSEEDENIAVLLAAQAAAAIENARLNEEQADLLRQLQSLQRQRDQFFAMINHELRNALTGVYGWAEQLQRARSDAAVQRATREVFESAERTIVLMNNLLDLSRLDAGKMQPVFKEVSLEAVVRRARTAVEPAAEAKQVAVRDEYVETPQTINTDALRLEQILVNLLSNAVRHSPRGEAVLVRADATGESVIINVMDRGPGIAAEEQEKIFEPYIRVDPESGLGSGLGLPVSRRMAELIGGRLAVFSDLGRGATFTITLPYSPDD